MRQLVGAVLVVVLGVLVPLVSQRIMNGAPEWLWRWVSLACVVVGVAIAVFSDPLWSRLRGAQQTPIGSTIIVAIASSVLCAATWWFLIAARPIPRETEQAESPAQVTLEGLFRNDFDYTLRRSRNITLTDSSGDRFTLLSQVYLDFSGGSKFVGFLVPQGEVTTVVGRHIAETYSELVGLVEEGVDISGGTTGQPQQFNAADLALSGRVYLYHHDHLTARQIADLEEYYEQKDLTLALRGADYLATRLIGAR